MIRFMHCMRRHSDLTPDQFRRYWQSKEFDALLNRFTELFGVVRIQKSLTLAVDVNQQMNRDRGADEPFDGVFEFWVDNARTVMERIGSEEGQLILKEIEEFQRQFVDFAGSRRFYTEWTPADAQADA